MPFLGGNRVCISIKSKERKGKKKTKQKNKKNTKIPKY